MNFLLEKIIQGSIGLDRSFYLNATEKNKEVIEAYKIVFTNVLRMFYGNISNVEKIMDNLIEFETKLAHIMCKK